MDPLLKTAVALAAGSIIVYGAIRRLQTIGSEEFVSTVRITVFLFAAFAVGLFVVDAPVAQGLASQLVFVPFAPEGRGRVAGIVLLCVFLIPSIVRILRGERFPEVWEWTLAWVLWPAGLLLATLYAYSIDESGLAPHVVELAWFLARWSRRWRSRSRTRCSAHCLPCARRKHSRSDRGRSGCTARPGSSRTGIF